MCQRLGGFDLNVIDRVDVSHAEGKSTRMSRTILNALKQVADLLQLQEAIECRDHDIWWQLSFYEAML